MQRFGQVISIKPGKLDYYLNLHANPWPAILKTIDDCHIRNYSIFLLNDNMLFAYFEYIGNNFEEDMQKMASDPETQRWWKETNPCQQPLGINPDEWWHNMKEIFHH